MNRWSFTLACLGLGVMAHWPARAQPPSVVMSAPWAQAMCNAWNADAGLTDKLVESGWMKNDAGRGFKNMQIFRTDCPKSARIELQISLKDNKSKCIYGGAARGDTVDGGADDLMGAETPRWHEKGSGEYGPMRAMMFGHLSFEGPKMEAMGNMGPFEGFLRLADKVPGECGSCS